VTSLEIRLRALGHELDVPPERDLAPGVVAQLEGRRPFEWRRAAVLGFALVAIAVGAAFAVPQARTAILRFFDLGGARVIRVDTLPPAVERKQAEGLGAPYSLKDAQRRLGFRLLLPRFKGKEPRRVYVLGDSVGTVIVRASPASHPLLLSEFKSAGEMGLKKLAFGETAVEPVQVGGHPGLWIEGGTHTLTYFDRALGFQQQNVFIHGNVLLWVRGGLTLRIEGKLSRSKAVALARTVR
jgi:hypothetical protein